jgi:hypothetical protein
MEWNFVNITSLKAASSELFIFGIYIIDFFKSFLLLHTHPYLGLPNSFFPSGVPTKSLYAFLFYPIDQC